MKINVHDQSAPATKGLVLIDSKSSTVFVGFYEVFINSNGYLTVKA